MCQYKSKSWGLTGQTSLTFLETCHRQLTRMPAPTSGTVLVTGANGYIAVWVIKSLLDAGFAVRGTVRAESKGTYLRNLFKSAGDKFDVVVVEDITKEGAFDEHVQDVAAIAHTATPVRLDAVEPDELIIPAMRGTLEILNAARTHGRYVQRVVVLSSTAAVTRPDLDPSTTLVLDESSWNEAEVAQCREKGRDATPLAKYRASKTLAERAAWEFVDRHRAEIAWDLVVLNPPFVYGPALHQVDLPENLNWSAKEWFDKVVKGELDDVVLANSGMNYVDVRDMALAHVLALQTPQAGGNRFIISAGPYKWQDFALIAHRIAPEAIPAGKSSYEPTMVKRAQKIYDNRKAIEILGMKFRTMEETARDTVEDFKARGWL
ncbi:NAD(P)-binding protein [Trametes punicea]|nr:NAD(P)-binding protein [Trametes punicea]